MITNVGFLIYVLVASAGCLYGAVERGNALAYGLIWLLLLAGGIHWYARRKNILWFAPRR